MCGRLGEPEIGYAERLQTGRVEEGGAAKIGNLDLPTSAYAGDDKYIRRFQVFVQDPDSMCSGHSFGYINEDTRADRSRNFIQSALSFRPLHQIRPSVFALQKKW